MQEVEMTVKEIADQLPLVCPKCNNKTNALYVLSIWWDRSICIDCCIWSAFHHKLKIVTYTGKPMESEA